jgi:hypothetical protein
MLRAISDFKEPQIAVLMTGDGAGYDDGVGFHADLERMHTAGWGIEVVSWDAHCRRALRDWALKNGVFVRLDDYYESVTFLEGGRRSQRLDLTHRTKAAPRPSPVVLAEMKTQKEADTRLRAMQAELDALKATLASKAKGKARYKKRMGRGKMTA